MSCGSKNSTATRRLVSHRNGINKIGQRWNNLRRSSNCGAAGNPRGLAPPRSGRTGGEDGAAGPQAAWAGRAGVRAQGAPALLLREEEAAVDRRAAGGGRRKGEGRPEAAARRFFSLAGLARTRRRGPLCF